LAVTRAALDVEPRPDTSISRTREIDMISSRRIRWNALVTPVLVTVLLLGGGTAHAAASLALVSPAAFQPESPGNAANDVLNKGTYLNAEGTVVAQVVLPAGATVKEFTAYIADPGAGGDMVVELVKSKIKFGGVTETQMAQVETVVFGGTEIQKVSTNFINEATVGASAFVYVRLTSTTFFDTLRFYGAQVKYTVP
jgi:hypothetical protein